MRGACFVLSGLVAVAAMQGAARAASAHAESGAGTGAAVRPDGVVLAPHVIRYELSLSRASDGDTVDGSGTMTYHVADECESWSAGQHLRLHTVTRDGGATDSVSDYATLESKDGAHFVFHTEEADDGRVRSKVEGEADRLPDGRVLVHFRQPAVKTVELPRGTLFPLAHTEAIIEAAREGRTSLAPLLFDGTTTDGAFYTYVTLGHWQPLPADPVVPHQGAVNAHVAFYSMAPGTVTPDFELGSRYFQDGVADRLMMDFGSFQLGGKVVSFRLGAPARCRHRIAMRR
ncbi:EipB family protein [Acidomonas methanolica]|uniref:EipB family protein n=1 Tax=Acidomonas methanolica TaxID=437 RepID=UPI00211A7EA3|nr:DUF1849 family protein [Acidomonas methanolica]MCQ9155030.1 DUF1849 family protein [Acidomonas methanolica]